MDCILINPINRARISTLEDNGFLAYVKPIKDSNRSNKVSIEPVKGRLNPLNTKFDDYVNSFGITKLLH